MDKNGLLRDLRSTLGDIFREADAGDFQSRQWLIESFSGHANFFRAIWPVPSERPVNLSPRDLKLLENSAWNIESRLLINRLAKMANEHTNNTR